MKCIQDLPTPAVLLDVKRMEQNLDEMQSVCDASGVELWPHCKTHKIIEVLERQLAAGAAGATVAKVGEAEALLPSGVKNLFLAHSIVQPELGRRLRVLKDHLERLIVAVTSAPQFEALEKILNRDGISAEALVAVDTGLGREGARDFEAATDLVRRVQQSNLLSFAGIYTHEGHGYGCKNKTPEEFATEVHSKLMEFREAIGGDASLWPGCSVTAKEMSKLPGVRAVRPGAYIFGDLSLTETHKVTPWNRVALTVLTTIVDQPSPDLALLDAGSKTFSSDRSAAGIHGRGYWQPEWEVVRLSEEHGCLQWNAGRAPKLGEKIQIVTAHVCPVLNLTDRVWVVEDEAVLGSWNVAARGKTN